MRTVHWLAATLLIAIPLSATAQDEHKTYIGLNAGKLKYSEEDRHTEDAHLAVIYGRFGVEASKHLALEARVGRTDQDTLTSYGIDVDFQVTSLLGAYGRLMWPVTPQVRLYGIAGLTRATREASASLGGFSAKAKESDTHLSVGLGADFHLTDAVTPNVEYLDWAVTENVDLAGVAGGLALRF